MDDAVRRCWTSSLLQMLEDECWLRRMQLRRRNESSGSAECGKKGGEEVEEMGAAG